MNEQFARDLLSYLGDVGTIEPAQGINYYGTPYYDVNWHLFGQTLCARFTVEFIRQTPRIRLLEHAVRQLRQQSIHGFAITEPPSAIAERVNFCLGKTGYVYLDYDIAFQIHILTWDICDVRCVMRFTQQDLRNVGETPFVSHVARIFRAQSKIQIC